MKPTEVRGKSAKECLKMIDEKKEELFALKLQLTTGQLAQTSNIRNTKRDIAMLYTVLKEKEKKGEEAKPNTTKAKG